MIGAFLDRARELAPELAAATDRLNDRIAEIESTLADLRLGVRASVPLEEGRSLVFGKEGNVWRLLVETERGVDIATDPLANCSRELRLQAMAMLFPLVSHLTQAIEVEIGRVNNAAALARTFVDEVNAATHTPPTI